MSEDGSSHTTSGSVHEDLSAQLANLLRTSFNSQNQNHKQTLSDSLKISLKLNSQNYALWARMIRVAIGGKSKNLLSHLTGKPPPSEPNDELYEQWEQDDLVVFSWLIQNIEPTLANNLTEFPTAKSLWDALIVTYSSGKDKLQTFDLHVKANDLKQNGSSLEDFWIALQGIWGEIERRDPNPMTCDVDIATYNKIRSEQKLIQFLNALDRQFDSTKREILRLDPLPSAEGAYAAVRKEMAHQGITISGFPPQPGVAAGLAAGRTQEIEGLGLGAKGQQRTGKSSFRIDKSKLKCSHCGMTKHTKDQCFKLVGFPEWWNDGHKKTKQTVIGGEKTNATSSGSERTKQSDDGGFGGIVSGLQCEAEGAGHPDCGDHWAWH